MSFVDSYMPTNPSDVQKCNRHITNILDYALGGRLIEIKGALGSLFPILSIGVTRRELLAALDRRQRHLLQMPRHPKIYDFDEVAHMVVRFLEVYIGYLLKFCLGLQDTGLSGKLFRLLSLSWIWYKDPGTAIYTIP